MEATFDISRQAREYPLFKPTSYLVLLSFSVVGMGVVAMASAMRSIDRLDPILLGILTLGYIAIIWGGVTLRPLLRDLYHDLSLREHFFLSVAHFLFFIAPIFMFKSRWFLVYSLIAVMFSLSLFVVTYQRYIRLFLLQLLLLLFSQLTSVYDDIADLVLIGWFMIFLVGGLYFARLLFVMERHLVFYPIHFSGSIRSLVPVGFLLSVATIIVLLTIPSNPYNARPNLGFVPGPNRVNYQQRVTSVTETSILDWLLRAFFLTALAFLMLWLYKKIREVLRKRKEVPLDYLSPGNIQLVAEPDDGPPIPRSDFEANRIRVIRAYERLCRHLGDVVLPREPSQTSTEYCDQVAEATATYDMLASLKSLTNTFEKARYLQAAVKTETADQFETKVAALIEQLRPADDADAPTN
jgi:hypothetical protein